MRDEWVDSMYSQLSNGNRNNNLDEIVTGMRSLLGVLEAMKLDVANHQIRCLRPVLIEDTTHFEQKFFLRKIESRKVDIGGARQWFSDASRRLSPSRDGLMRKFGHMGFFFEALVQLVLPSTAEKRVPSTFLFDEERILKLRSDMVDAINLEVCVRLYQDLARRALVHCSPGWRGLGQVPEPVQLSSPCCSRQRLLRAPTPAGKNLLLPWPYRSSALLVRRQTCSLKWKRR